MLKLSIQMNDFELFQHIITQTHQLLELFINNIALMGHLIKTNRVEWIQWIFEICKITQQQQQQQKRQHDKFFGRGRLATTRFNFVKALNGIICVTFSMNLPVSMIEKIVMTLYATIYDEENHNRSQVVECETVTMSHENHTEKTANGIELVGLAALIRSPTIMQ